MGHKLLFFQILILAFTFSSCAWLDKIERNLIEEEVKNKNGVKRSMIPKIQYDELLVKYEELQKEYKNYREKNPSTPNSVVASQDLNSPVQTVDVFAPAPSLTGQSKETPSLNSDEIVAKYQAALKRKELDANAAMQDFMALSKSGLRSVEARSFLQLGHHFFKLADYDLAMQNYETVVIQYSESSAVLDALKNLVTCTDKLSLKEKKEQYQSLIVDVFQWEI
jgi:hypothetical protein